MNTLDEYYYVCSVGVFGVAVASAAELRSMQDHEAPPEAPSISELLGADPSNLTMWD